MFVVVRWVTPHIIYRNMETHMWVTHIICMNTYTYMCICVCETIGEKTGREPLSAVLHDRHTVAPAAHRLLPHGPSREA